MDDHADRASSAIRTGRWGRWCLLLSGEVPTGAFALRIAAASRFLVGVPYTLVNAAITLCGGQLADHRPQPLCNSTTTRVPSPSPDVTAIRPPCASVSVRAIHNPSPAP